ncbi:MAG: O-unit flippase-like protein [Odoribacter sp.]
MEIKITKKDVLWGYTAQFFNIGSGIILLPLILRLLSPELIGVWYIFLTISGLVQMLDFGFQPTFTRNVSYIFSGATQIQAEGLDEKTIRLTTPNYPLLKNLITEMKRFYRIISFGIILILLTLGSWYINNRTHHIPAHPEVMLAWLIYMISTVFNFYYSYYNALLTGKGLVKKNNQLIIITRAISLILAATGLLLGYGLIAVACANLCSIIINRILAVRFFYTKELKKILQTTLATSQKLLPIIWFNAKKVGISNLGGYFVQKGNLLFISMFLPLETVGSYGLTLNIITILSGISPLYLSTHLPEIYKDRIDHNMMEIRRIFGESILVYYLLYISGALVILISGNWILEFLHSKTLLIPLLPLSILLITQFLESNHGMAATLITTRNEVPYLKASLVSGFSIGILSLLSLSFTQWGITGVICLTGLVQISYNNWKWPLMVSHELEKSYPQLIKIGILSLRGWFFRHFHLSH